ncbi:MAG: hypothetical protein RMM98_13850 [Acidobacteriota bacterium]|nr:hypothetical protein [Blastocatellia bacterium]MDW8240688.1 hypothetical protein [Acidobacteriota bacterium]
MKRLTNHWSKIFVVTMVTVLVAATLHIEGFSQGVITWEPTNGPWGGHVRALTVNAGGDIFAGTNGGVFRSTDDGDSWTAIHTA